MEKQFCVFWFPSIYHTFLNERLQKFEVEKNISDFGPDAAKLVVSIDYPYEKKQPREELEKAQRDILLVECSLRFEVYETIGGENQLIFENFVLEHESHTNNGMVVYSYEKPRNYPSGNGIPPFEKALTTIFYHCAKSLFHNHEVQTDRDSGLVAYIPDLTKFDPKKSLRDPDNEAIKYFIEQYENIFMSYAEKASGFIAQRDAIVAKFEGKINLSEEDFNMSGYKSLIQYGRGEFKHWYQDESHPSDVIQCKKDVYNWRFSYYRRGRKRRRQHYINRLEKIATVLLSMPVDSLTDEKGKENIERYKDFDDILKKWKDNEVWKKQTRKDVSWIDYLMGRFEMELGIVSFNTNCRKLYRELKKCYLDLPRLTEDVRKKTGMLCEGALTEYVYCKTLLESKYNTLVTHSKFDTTGKSEEIILELDKWRKKACNIRNAIRYIETVKYRCKNAETNGVKMILKKAEKLSHKASVWTAVGIILSVVGVALTTVGIILAIRQQPCICK